MLTRAPGQRSGLTEVAALVAVNALVLMAAVARPRLLPLALLAALAAPAVVAIVERPQRGVLILAALVPFNGLLRVVPHPGIVSGWKEALVGATLLATFVCPMSARRTGPRRMPPWLPALAGFAVCAVVAAAAHFDPLRAAVGLKLTFYYAALAWALIRCPFDATERDRLVSVLMATGVIVAVIGLLQQVVGPARLHDLGFEYNSTIRFAGGFFRSFSTFDLPFGFGFYTMAVLLICVPVALTDTSRRRNALFLACVPLIALGMATSVVRGAFLGLGIGLAYLGASRYRILLLAFPLGLVAVLLLPGDVSTTALSASSTQQRAAGWSENLKVVSTHPLGIGPGSSSAAAERVAAAQRVGAKAAYQPDNYYYHVAFEDGLPAMWFFCLLLGSGFLCARKMRAATSGDDSALYAGASAFLLAAAGTAFVASFFEIFPMDVLTWVLFGVVSAPLVSMRAGAAETVSVAR